MLRRLAILCVLVLWAAPAWAAPVQLAFEGRLTSAAGGPVADGAYAMGVSLYAQDKGGNPVFTELFLAVNVQSGLFATSLGAGNSVLDSDLFVQGKAAWVGVTVGGDPELPRVALRRVPTAIHAQVAAAALDVQCSGCIAVGELAAGAVTSEALAPGAVQSGHVAFGYAGSDSKGGPATSALTAKLADYAKGAGTADVAALADEAKLAAALKCTGCVTAAMLADATVADLVAAGKLAKVAQSGKYVDLAGGPDLTPYAQLGAVNEWPKAQTFAGGVILGGNQDFALNQALKFRFQNADKAPVVCDAKSIGLAYYDTAKQALMLCNGTVFKAFAAVSPQGTQTNPAVSCKAILDAGDSTGSGKYWLKKGDGSAFQAFCDMVTEGGGWTRFMTVTDTASFKSIAGVPNGTEFVDNGTWQFSTAMMKASNREVLIMETVAPNRMHKYDFKLGDNLAGDNFVGAITGDVNGSVGVFNWLSGAYEPMNAGKCNSNNHTQWNCEPPGGVRFHIGTRDWTGDGGSNPADGTWYFTGYANSIGGYTPVNLGKYVKNWNGAYNATPHDFFFR